MLSTDPTKRRTTAIAKTQISSVQSRDEFSIVCTVRIFSINRGSVEKTVKFVLVDLRQDASDNAPTPNQPT